MISETYLSHPNFGLLFSLCFIESNRTLYTTLYAQRLFFIVCTDAPEIEFQAVSRSEARMIVEGRLRALRRSGTASDYDQLKTVHQQTFQ